MSVSGEKVWGVTNCTCEKTWKLSPRREMRFVTVIPETYPNQYVPSLSCWSNLRIVPWQFPSSAITDSPER